MLEMEPSAHGLCPLFPYPQRGCQKVLLGQSRARQILDDTERRGQQVEQSLRELAPRLDLKGFGEVAKIAVRGPQWVVGRTTMKATMAVWEADRRHKRRKSQRWRNPLGVNMRVASVPTGGVRGIEESG